MIQEWFSKTIDKNLKIVLWICLLIILCMFLWNIATNQRGTYTDYNEMIYNLFAKPMTTQPKKNHESRGEQECRKAIQKITGKPFNKARPSFLRNEITGQCLELDCFNADVNIAVEYNGIQHYQYTPRFHSSKDAFYNTKYRDKIKKELCEKHGVRLIVVPYTVAIENIEAFLREQL